MKKNGPKFVLVEDNLSIINYVKNGLESEIRNGSLKLLVLSTKEEILGALEQTEFARQDIIFLDNAIKRNRNDREGPVFFTSYELTHNHGYMPHILLSPEKKILRSQKGFNAVRIDNERYYYMIKSQMMFQKNLDSIGFEPSNTIERIIMQIGSPEKVFSTTKTLEVAQALSKKYGVTPLPKDNIVKLIKKLLA